MPSPTQVSPAAASGWKGMVGRRGAMVQRLSMMDPRVAGAGWLWAALALGASWSMAKAETVQLDAIDTPSGYLARLLINEVPFPGERSYRSEQDSSAGMLGLLWVLHARIGHIPPSYSQQEVAGTVSTNILETLRKTPR